MPVKTFHYIFLIGLIVEGTIRFPYAKEYRKLAFRVDRFTNTEKIVLFIAFLGNIFIPVLYIIEPVFGSADYHSPSWVGWAGVVVLSCSIWVFWRSHADLGKSWSPTLQIMEDHQLKTHGVYRFMRHPMYASMWLLAVAQALLLNNWIAGLSGLVGFLPLYLIRVPREEEMMIEHFGDAYKTYMNNTGRIIPRFGKARGYTT
jgi:protein-S-isoprenylcysteine O-methyltransferase Ste14